MVTINKYFGWYNISTRYEKPKYIVVHYTGAGSSSAGNALANCKYFAACNRNASADFFIDDSGIWQYNPDITRYYTWAVGDGYGRYGITNSNSIEIEVCQAAYANYPFTANQISSLRQLVTYLMKQYSIPESRVVRHYDASRKLCPYYYANNTGAWTTLKKKITGGGDVGIIQCQPNMTNAQLWKLIPDGEYFKVQCKTGQVLDVKGGTCLPIANGRVVQAYTDNGTDAQRWKKIDGVGGGFRLVSKLDENYCLDVKNGTVGARKNILLHKLQEDENSQWAQSFFLMPYYGGGEWSSIINCKSGYAVDANPNGYDYA